MKITEKYVLNLILSIILVFSLAGSGAAFFAKQYLLDADTFIAVSDEKNIPQKAYDEINEYFTQSAAYSGIPADVYMSALTVDNVKMLIDLRIQHMFTYIYAVGSGELEEHDFNDTDGIDFEQLEQNITNYFDEFAKENNVEVNDEYTAQLEKTIDTAKNEIMSITDIYMISLIDETGIITKVRSVYNYIDPIIYACAGLALVCIILIAVFSRKNICSAFYWISVSVMCTAVLALIPTLYLKLSGITDKLIVRNECVYAAFTGLFSDIISTLLLAEIIILAVGIILLVTGGLISKLSGKKA
ncbi:MAG: hypothetical protein IJX24_01315 [Oscillospiraceae bacterium]|nr:hypothetical protein [Oscillospiraceae bacterium]